MERGVDAMNSAGPRRRRVTGAGAVAVFVIACVLSVIAQDQSDYIVGPLDVLTINVWKHADLSGTFRVGAEGSLTFPLLGAVKVGGLSRRDIEQELQRRLADGFVRDPQVTVGVEEFHSQRVFITGEIREPGAIPLSGPMTLLEALARAGSVTERAGAEAIIARPKGAAAATKPAPFDSSADILRVDIGELQRGRLTHNVTLKNGDTILIPRAETAYVMGEVKAPGEYPIANGTRVAEMLSRAGGITERGSSRRIRVMRFVNGTKSERAVRLEDLVEPGDVLVVRERLF